MNVPIGRFNIFVIRTGFLRKCKFIEVYILLPNNVLNLNQIQSKICFLDLERIDIIFFPNRKFLGALIHIKYVFNVFLGVYRPGCKNTPVLVCFKFKTTVYIIYTGTSINCTVYSVITFK